MREERMDFLKSLGAEHPVVEVEEEVLEQPDHQQRRKPPARLSQGESINLRIRYARLSPAHLVGHLDTARRLPRILRRTGVIAEYSSGFSPRPRMVFGPTLPLGTESLDEVVDIRVIKSTVGDLSTLPSRLTVACPPGIQVLSAVVVPKGEKTLSKAATLVEYRVYVLGTPELQASEEAELRQGLTSRIEEFLAGDKFEVTVDRKNGSRVREARGEVVEMEMEDVERLKHAFSPPGGVLCAVRVVQDLKPSPSVRPAELVAALLGDDQGVVEFEVIRTRVVLAESAKPLPETGRA
jgi:radical SAM-linked protein